MFTHERVIWGDFDVYARMPENEPGSGWLLRRAYNAIQLLFTSVDRSLIGRLIYYEEISRWVLEYLLQVSTVRSNRTTSRLPTGAAALLVGRSTLVGTGAAGRGGGYDPPAGGAAFGGDRR